MADSFLSLLSKGFLVGFVSSVKRYVKVHRN
nr:MAG TPA: hypothetical protein [Caudoviricetes sp.]